MTADQEAPNESSLAIGDYLQVLEDEVADSLLRRGDVVRVIKIDPTGFDTDGRGLDWTSKNSMSWTFSVAQLGTGFRRLDGLRLPEVRTVTELTPGAATES